MTATATASPKAKRGRKTTNGGIVLSGESLKRLIRDLEPAVPNRSPTPILGSILLANGVAVATDLEIRIAVPLPEAAGEPMLVPFAKLKSIAATLRGSDEVRLSIDGTLCVVEAGGGTWRLPVESPLEFPAGDTDTGKPIGRLPAEQLQSLLKAVKYATDDESSRYALGAVCVEFDRGEADSEDGTITFVATDGRRLSAASAKVATQDLDSSQTLVPSRAALALMRLAASAQAVQMSATGSEFVAVIGEYVEGEGVTGTTLRARITDGRFPRWQDVDKKPKTEPSEVIVGDLLHAVRMAEICTSETSKSVTLQVTSDGLKLSARAAETGEAAVECPLQAVGHLVTVRIDPRFAEQWLACGSFDQAEVVKLEATDAGSAVVLRLDNYRTVIMPMAAD